MSGKRMNPALEVQLLRKENLELRLKLEIMKGVTVQQCLDIAQVSLNKSRFRFGPKRNREFEEIFKQTFWETAKLCVMDSEDDDEISYTKGCLDRDLRQARGEDTPDFDIRYDPANLYFRRAVEKEIKEEKKK